MGQRAASTRRSEATSTISGQSVVINTGTGITAYSSAAGTQTVGGSSGTGATISNIVYTDSAYNILTATAASTSIGYFKILGSGFTASSNVFLNGANVNANITYVSTTELRANIVSQPLGTYSIMVYTGTTGGIYYQGV